jgi:lipopolysaccharide transport system permease protein
MSIDCADKESTPPSEGQAVPNGRPQSAEDMPETIIESTRKWWHLNLWEIWQRRELIYFLIRRDVKVRYRQTMLGGLWAILQPAMFMVIFTIFIGPYQTEKGLWPYPIHVYSGFLAWTLFASSISSASSSIVASESLISKIYFPRLVIPLAAVGGYLVDFAVGSLGLIALMVWYGVGPNGNIMYLPLCIGLLMLAGFGAGTLFAALNVKYRDFRYLVPFILQAWMFSTPSLFIQAAATPQASIFGSQNIYEQARALLTYLNPMTGILNLFRAATLGGPVPWDQVAFSSTVILCFVVLGCFYFRRVEDTFADII